MVVPWFTYLPRDLSYLYIGGKPVGCNIVGKKKTTTNKQKKKNKNKKQKQETNKTKSKACQSCMSLNAFL